MVYGEEGSSCASTSHEDEGGESEQYKTTQYSIKSTHVYIKCTKQKHILESTHVRLYHGNEILRHFIPELVLSTSVVDG